MGLVVKKDKKIIKKIKKEGGKRNKRLKTSMKVVKNRGYKK